MRSVFLARLHHWLALVIAFAVLWAVGVNHLHTSAFNTFAVIAFGGGLALVLVIVLPHKRGDRVTRDPIEIPDEANPDLGPSSD